MTGVAVVSVPVTDQDRAAAFYTEHLGFRVIEDAPMGPEMRWVQLAAGDAPTTLTLTTWFDTMTARCGRGPRDRRAGPRRVPGGARGERRRVLRRGRRDLGALLHVPGP